jgi:nitrogen fixation protein NifQ
LTLGFAWHTGFALITSRDTLAWLHPRALSWGYFHFSAMTHSFATRAQLLAASATPDAPGTALFATLLAAHDDPSLLGLSSEQFALLAGRHFGATRPPRASLVIRSEEQARFVSALVAFLLSHVRASSAADAADADCLASIIAHACLRPDHLWRDLGLGGRDEVTDMLSQYFPALVARNVDGMRWKKFLARELALSLGLTPQPAPGCSGCEDFSFCFGGEA